MATGGIAITVRRCIDWHNPESRVSGLFSAPPKAFLLIALLGIFIDDDLQRLNGLKNLLVCIANCVAAIVFVLIYQVAWGAAIIIAAGSAIGGCIGATVGRRLPAHIYRSVIIAVGIVAAVGVTLR